MKSNNHINESIIIVSLLGNLCKYFFAQNFTVYQTVEPASQPAQQQSVSRTICTDFSLESIRTVRSSVICSDEILIADIGCQNLFQLYSLMFGKFYQKQIHLGGKDEILGKYEFVFELQYKLRVLNHSKSIYFTAIETLQPSLVILSVWLTSPTLPTLLILNLLTCSQPAACSMQVRVFAGDADGGDE